MNELSPINIVQRMMDVNYQQQLASSINIAKGDGAQGVNQVNYHQVANALKHGDFTVHPTISLNMKQTIKLDQEMFAAEHQQLQYQQLVKLLNSQYKLQSIAIHGGQ